MKRVVIFVMSELNVIKRGRGRVLLENGFQYYQLSKYKNLQTLWRCAMYKKTKCSGTVTTSEVPNYFVKSWYEPTTVFYYY